jgi:hypothetical protein
MSVPSGLELFILQLCGSEFSVDAKLIVDGIEQLDAASDTSPDAAGLYEFVYWICRHPQHDVREKLEMCQKLLNLKGRVEGTPRELTGWR